MYLNNAVLNLTLNGKVQEVQLCPRYFENYNNDSYIVMLYETEKYLLETRKYTMYTELRLPSKLGI